MKKHFAILFLACVCLVCAAPLRNTDALKQSLNGLTVSPAIQQIALLQGQDSTTFTSMVTNNTLSEVTVHLSVQDFTALNDTGSVSFLGSSSADNPHGLAVWTKLGYSQVVLRPGAAQIVPVSITDTNKLAPGGHYAAITYSIVSSPSSAVGNRINANNVVSSLIFLTTYGQATSTLRLEQPQQHSFTFHMPNNLNIVFNNTGSTQTAPRGLVTITGATHKEVARGIVNVDSGLILPGTSRLYSIPLTFEQRLQYPGIYTLHVSFRTDGATTLTTYTQHFLFINQPLLIALVAILFVIAFWLIRRFPSTKKYILRD